MSTVEISLRLTGTLPPLEQLTQDLGVLPTQSLRRGQQVSKRRVQLIDLWCLELAKFDSATNEIAAELIDLAQVLKQVAPGIAKLDRSQCQIDLYISTIRDEDQGGLFLPPELVSAAAAIGASIQVSILDMFGDLLDSPISAGVEHEQFQPSGSL